MNNINVKGNILILNTIDNLEPDLDVKIATNSLSVCEDGRCKLHMKAQFISKDLTVDGYIVPLRKEKDGSLLLDFSEVRFVFGRTSIEDFDKLSKDWVEYSAICEKQKTDTDIFSRYPLDDLSGAFWHTIYAETQNKERVVNLVSLFKKKIANTTDIKDLQYQLEVYNKNFLQDLEESKDYDEEVERANDIDHFVKNIKPSFTKIVKSLEARIAELKTLTADNMSEEEMQKILKEYLEKEDYINAGLQRDKMKLKGFTPQS